MLKLRHIFSSIKFKLTFTFFSIYAVSFLLIFYCTLTRFKNVLEKNLYQQNIEKIVNLSGKIGDALKWGNWATLEATLKRRFKNNPDWLFILIKDKNGDIIVSTDDALIDRKQADYLPPFILSSANTIHLDLDPWEGITQSISYRQATITEDIFHGKVVAGASGEAFFDAYVDISQNDRLLGSVRIGFSRRNIERDILYLKLFIGFIGAVSIVLSILTVFFITRNLLRSLTELSKELSKLKLIDNPEDLLVQLDLVRIENIKTNTSELNTLKETSLRFKQQLVANVEHAVRYSQLETHARKLETIAKTTQMLAHDVRKPFTMLEMILQTLRECKSSDDIRRLSHKFLPDVQNAMASVNGMIDDVMEIGRTAKPKQVAVSPESIVDASLKEVCRIYRNTVIDLSFRFNHQHMINIDALKIQRVISNIVSNAFQAMNFKGTLWITTNESSTAAMTTFCIGNSGSCVPEEDTTKVFDMFYTKNKTVGTGLGLAISQKIINEHGGEIWCKSSVAHETFEIFFTLPVSFDHLDTATVTLAENTQDLIKAVNTTSPFSEENQSVGIADPRRPDFEKKIEAYIKRINRKIKLGIADDEEIYRNALVDLVDRSKTLKNAIDTFLFKDSDSVLKAFDVNTPDLLICDIDLGPYSLNGFEIVASLRKKGYDHVVCIHSNRSLPQDYEKSFKVGAQAFLPKPMTREHLIKFINDSLPEIDLKNTYSCCDRKNRFDNRIDEDTPVNINAIEKYKLAAHKLGYIILVEDEWITRNIWENILQPGHLITFENPASFWRHIEKDKRFIDQVFVIIIDNYFNDLSYTGIEFAKDLKNSKIDKPLFLSSGSRFIEEELNKLFIMQLNKIPQTGIEQLCEWIVDNYLAP